MIEWLYIPVLAPVTIAIFPVRSTFRAVWSATECQVNSLLIRALDDAVPIVSNVYIAVLKEGVGMRMH